MKYAFLVLALAGCASGQTSVETVSVPVAVGCIGGERPDPVHSLQSQHPDWSEKTVKQKAELVSAQALRYKSYSEAVDAATGQCF